MKTKKLIRYRLPVSATFPAKHKRAAEPTCFADKILKKESEIYNYLKWHKIHTICANYPFWAKRFEKIYRGEAVLELYYWSGKPYRSKSITICQLSKYDGIGIQKLNFYGNSILHPYVYGLVDYLDLSKNDGLSFDDFKGWFKDYDLSKPMAIIHFTNFRY